MKKQPKLLIGIMAAIAVLVVVIISIVMTAASGSKDTYDNHMELAQRYLDELQYEQAIAEYEAAIAIDPKNPEAYLGLAEVYVAMGDTEKALEVLVEGYEQTQSDRIAKRLEELARAERDLSEKNFGGEEQNEVSSDEDESGLLIESAEEPMVLPVSNVTGTFENTNWMISTDGKLVVEGTGEAGFTNLMAGALYRTLPWYEYRDSIISAEIRMTEIKDASYFFSGCTNLVYVDLKDFDTSNVLKMNSMFMGCENLTNIEWGNFNTSNVEYMDHMFYDCGSLISLDVSSFETSKVTDMEAMFLGCQSLITLDLGNFDTSNVTHMRDMFWGCSSLTNLDLSNFNLSGFNSPQLCCEQTKRS